MTEINAEHARTVLREADLLFPVKTVNNAIEQLAERISTHLREADPLVLVVMNGALIPASLLFVHMDFPFQISYLHVTRYRGATRGGEVHWVARPGIDIQDRTVLVIDDIFDEGHTLRAIINELNDGGAARVLSAVLVNKQHSRKVDLAVDFVGLEVPDRYVFGCGMDYKEYWRNLPAIYAVKDL